MKERENHHHNRHKLNLAQYKTLKSSSEWWFVFWMKKSILYWWWTWWKEKKKSPEHGTEIDTQEKNNIKIGRENRNEIFSFSFSVCRMSSVQSYHLTFFFWFRNLIYPIGCYGWLWLQDWYHYNSNNNINKRQTISNPKKREKERRKIKRW